MSQIVAYMQFWCRRVIISIKKSQKNGEYNSETDFVEKQQDPNYPQ